VFRSLVYFEFIQFKNAFFSDFLFQISIPLVSFILGDSRIRAEILLIYLYHKFKILQCRKFIECDEAARANFSLN